MTGREQKRNKKKTKGQSDRRGERKMKSYRERERKGQSEAEQETDTAGRSEGKRIEQQTTLALRLKLPPLRFPGFNAAHLEDVAS